MFAYFGVPIPWSQVMKRTVKEIGEDNCLGLAAMVAIILRKLPTEKPHEPRTAPSAVRLSQCCGSMSRASPF